MRSKSSRGEREERRRDELRYLALQSCARYKLRLSLGYSGTCKSPETPTFRCRVSQPLLHRRWHPRHSNQLANQKSPTAFVGSHPTPVNSLVLSLSPYLVNPLSVRRSIRLAICFIALSIYLSFCLNHYTHIRAVFHTEVYTCFINAYVSNISFRYKINQRFNNLTLFMYLSYILKTAFSIIITQKVK